MKRALKLGVSLLLTVGFTAWAFRGTNVHEQWMSLKSANYLWLLPYFVLLLGVHLARTLRWGCLLSGLERLPFKPLNEASAIGFMMLIVLPFRLGEFARPFLIAQRSNIRRSAAMTSVVLERIVDGVTIALLLRVLLLFVPSETPEVRYVKLGANLMFLVFGGGLAFLLFAAWQQVRAVRLVRAVAGLVSERVADKVAAIVETFVGALRQLPDARQLLAFFLYTALYWGLNGLGAWLLAHAFDCTSGRAGCVPMHLSVFESFVVLSVLVVGLMIPAAPGSMGTFQAAIKVALALFLPTSVVQSSGLAYANVMWICQIGQQVLLGLVYMSLSHLSFSDLAGKLGKDAEAPAILDPRPAPGPSR